MQGQDIELARRVRDVIAVVVEDIDAVVYDVEDGIAYIEGVVPSEAERTRIRRAVQRLGGVRRVITCLSTERIFKHAVAAEQVPDASRRAQPPMFAFHSLS